MIQAFNLSVEYKDGLTALKDINLHIQRGEFAFLVGPSGAGKSTLLKLITREVVPSKGQLFINGKSIIRLRSGRVPFLRRAIGIVFQDFRLLENKTAYENVAYALQVVECPKREIRERAMAALELVGLAEKANSHPHEMSGGEQQRVAIARAIVNHPLLIIADEPTGNLDPDTSWEIINLFFEINKRGTTVVVATHDKEMVNRSKKRVIALENGTIIRDQQRGGYGDEA